MGETVPKLTQRQADWLVDVFGADLPASLPGVPGGGETGAPALSGAPAQSGAPALSGPPAASGAPHDGPLPQTPVYAAFSIDAPQPGKGGSWHDDSHIDFDSVYTLVWISPDSNFNISRIAEPFDKRTKVGFHVPGKGYLSLRVVISGMQDDWDGNEHFEQAVTAKWNITADADGKLTIERDGQPEIGKHDGGTNYRLDSVNPDEKSSSVSISPIIVGTSDSDSSDHSTTINVLDVGSHTEGGGKSKTTAPPKVQTSIIIDLNPVKPPAPPPPPPPPPPPEPKGTATVGNEVQEVGRFEYTVGPFKVGKTELEGGSVTKRVYEIFHGLPEVTRDGLIQGRLAGEQWEDGSKTDGGEKIEVHGYTSNTDAEDRNFALSKKRAEAVLAAFKSLGVPETAFAPPIPHGEWEVHDETDPKMTPTDDPKKEKESADWRKVVLFIKHPVTVST